MEYKMKLDKPALYMEFFTLILEPCWELVCKVFDETLKTHTDCPINLADFGACEGNTFLPYSKLVIGHIRRSSKTREIVVTLNDQHANDFNALVRHVTAFQKEMNDPLLRVCITPGNVYGQCLPNNSIDLGSCTFVVHVHCLSEPVNLDKDLFYIPSRAKNEEEIRDISSNDWNYFLKARSLEMKKGSLFLVNVPFTCSDILRILSDEFYQLHKRNIISQEELYNTNVPINTFRTEDDLRAPFEDSAQELGLQLLHISSRPVKLYENRYIVNGFKSWMHSSLVAGLSKTRTDQEAQAICEIYFENLENCFAGWKWIDLHDLVFNGLKPPDLPDGIKLVSIRSDVISV